MFIFRFKSEMVRYLFDELTWNDGNDLCLSGYDALVAALVSQMPNLHE